MYHLPLKKNVKKLKIKDLNLQKKVIIYIHNKTTQKKHLYQRY